LAKNTLAHLQVDTNMEHGDFKKVLHHPNYCKLALFSDFLPLNESPKSGRENNIQTKLLP
jgi:hypothetical protein